MESNIQIENEVIVMSLETVCKLYATNGDSANLYLFYHKTSKLQKTNQVWAVNSFTMKGLGWGKSRLTKATKVLKDLGLIENIQVRGEDGKMKGSYIKINYLKGSTSQQNHRYQKPQAVETTGGKQTTNALSSKKINALSSKKLISTEGGNEGASSLESKKEKVAEVVPPKTLKITKVARMIDAYLTARLLFPKTKQEWEFESKPMFVAANQLAELYTVEEIIRSIYYCSAEFESWSFQGAVAKHIQEGRKMTKVGNVSMENKIIKVLALTKQNEEKLYGCEITY